MIQEIATVLWNTLECAGYFRMGLQCHPDYRLARPGQFVMLRRRESLHPLLRRPFSIHRLIRTGDRVEGIEILYKVVGAGTDRLSVSRKGDTVDLLGPLGSHFSIPGHVKHPVIVGGGVGVAPLVFLVDQLRQKGIDPSQCVVFIGGRSKDDVLCVDDLARLGLETVHISTDDGSSGEKDVVTGPLERSLSARRPDMVYACGPLPMLKALARITRNLDIPCQVSVECLMACGMGACLGCAVEAADDAARYLHACTDGPVFDSKALKW